MCFIPSMLFGAFSPLLVFISTLYFAFAQCIHPVFSVCLLAETLIQLRFPPPKTFPSSWKAHRSAEAASSVPPRKMHGAGGVAVLGLWAALRLICEITFRLSSCWGC